MAMETRLISRHYRAHAHTFAILFIFRLANLDREQMFFFPSNRAGWPYHSFQLQIIKSFQKSDR